MRLQQLFKLTTCFIIAVTSQTATAGVLSGPIVNPNNGNTYYLLESVPSTSVPNPFDASQAEAQSLGGNLVTVNDAAEDAWIFDTFNQAAIDASPASNRKSLLLGLSDEAIEGTFQWVSGEALGYTNWGVGQPQAIDPDEDFVGIALSNNAFIQGSKWHDIVFAAGDVVYGVVEVAVPEPTTAMLLVVSCFVVVVSRRPSRL